MIVAPNAAILAIRNANAARLVAVIETVVALIKRPRARRTPVDRRAFAFILHMSGLTKVYFYGMVSS